MWITQLELRDIKSYGPSTRIEFAQGINAIIGPNGAGKSTILEAIGFALFDTSPHTQRRFVREGASRGEIIVTFVDALDEREYQVVRPVGGGKPYVYDPEIRRRVVTGKKNLLDWLYEHLRIDPTAKLKSLFDDAIGVPQGTLTAPFLENAPVRKAKFDPLLQVDDYETAWKALRDTVSHVRDQRNGLEKRIVGLQTRLVALPELEQGAEELRTQVEVDKEEKIHVTARLVKVNEELTNLHDLKNRIDALTGDLKQLEGRIEGMDHRLSDARGAVREARDAQETVQKAEPGYRSFQAAQARLTELDAQREGRDKLQAGLRDIEGNLALNAQTIKAHQQALDEMAHAATRLVELKPLVSKQDEVEADLRVAEQDVERWQEAQRRVREEEERLEKLRTRLTQVRTDLAIRRKVEAEVETLSAQREQADRELVRLETQLAEQDEALNQAIADLDVARQAAWELEQAQGRLTEETERLSKLEAELERVRTGLQERQQVEASLAGLKQQNEQQEGKCADLDREETVLQTQYRMLSERLGVLKQADQAVCPVCQQSLATERVDELAAHYDAEAHALSQRMGAVHREKRDFEDRLVGLKAQITSHKDRLTHLPTASRETELSADIDAQQDAVTTRREQVQPLVGADERLQTQQANCREQTELRDALRAQRRKARKEVERIGGEISVRQNRIADLPHPDREQELRSEIEAQRQTVDEHQRRVDSLNDATIRVETLQEKVTSLGDPRGEKNRLMAKVEKRPQEEASLREEQTRREELEAASAEVTIDLQAYSNLDMAITEQRDVSNQYRGDYDRYQQHRQIAQTLSDRQHKVTEIEEDCCRLEDEREQTCRDLDAAQEDYDEAQHRDLAAEQKSIEERKATLTERLRLNQDRLQEMVSRIAELRRLQDELKIAESERDILNALHEAVNFIRETIREAGPYVTRALVQTISAEADRVFGDILDDYTMRLRWEEDYGIITEQRGNEREFSQLSGGEKVAAALAVRLALLCEMSDIRVAFFDEPTAHLDDDRRDNLAEQLTQIKGFGQLFVISHDDTFERETHHVLRVSKDDGISQVEVG